MTDKIKAKLLQEIKNRKGLYPKENVIFEILKAKLQQHEETKKDILEKINDWWRNTMQISSTSTRLEKLKKEILK